MIDRLLRTAFFQINVPAVRLPLVGYSEAVSRQWYGMIVCFVCVRVGGGLGRGDTLCVHMSVRVCGLRGGGRGVGGDVDISPLLALPRDLMLLLI